MFIFDMHMISHCYMNFIFILHQLKDIGTCNKKGINGD